MACKSSQRLNKEEVRKAIYMGYPKRPIRCETLPFEKKLMEKDGVFLSELKNRYTDDVISLNITISYWESDYNDEDYRFAMRHSIKNEDDAIDNSPIIRDWSELDSFIEQFPRMDRPEPFERIKNLRQENPDSYILVSFGHYFFQRLASLRGIENCLFDFYDYPDELHAVLGKLLELYTVWTEKAAESGADGITGGEDLGTQRGLFISPDYLREFIFPYYKKMSECFVKNNLDFWMHTCGNVTEVMEDLIKSGVKVLHPIQAGTMDDNFIASKYSGKICFNVGMDVQNLIPFGSPEEVKKGVKERASKFYNDFGGVVYSAGNVIVNETPIKNIEAYAKSLDEFCVSVNRS